MLKHQLAKRQTNDETTPTPEDMAICGAQLNDVLCTAGITQGFIDAGLSCNAYRSLEQPPKEANSCAKGEGGQFCGSLWNHYSIGAYDIRVNCSRVLLLNSCLSNCRSLLEDFRNTLGCCINAYFNDSAYIGVNSLDYRVWNLCSVPLPPTACENSPTISPPDNVQDCTNEEFFYKYYAENLCVPAKRQLYSGVLRRLGARFCGNVSPDDVRDLCSVDTNGVPCGALYHRSEADLARLNSICSTSDVSCTSSCRDGITTAKNRYGCCFSSGWFNRSSLGISALNPIVLKSCDIELPEACEGVIGSATSIMKENNILLIIGGLMCLQLI